MIYGTLSTEELVCFAEQSPRYGTDPLFTELVERCAGAQRGVDTLVIGTIKPLVTDARGTYARP